MVLVQCANVWKCTAIEKSFSANYHNKIPFIYKNPYKCQLIDNQNTNKTLAMLRFITRRSNRKSLTMALLEDFRCA